MSVPREIRKMHSARAVDAFTALLAAIEAGDKDAARMAAVLLHEVFEDEFAAQQEFAQ